MKLSKKQRQKKHIKTIENQKKSGFQSVLREFFGSKLLSHKDSAYTRATSNLPILRFLKSKAQNK